MRATADQAHRLRGAVLGILDAKSPWDGAKVRLALMVARTVQDLLERAPSRATVVDSPIPTED